MEKKNNDIADFKEINRIRKSTMFMVNLVKSVIKNRNFKDNIKWQIDTTKVFSNGCSLKEYLPEDIEDNVLKFLNNCSISHIDSSYSIELILFYNIKIVSFKNKIILTLSKTDMSNNTINKTLNTFDKQNKNKKQWVLILPKEEIWKI